MYRHIYAFKNSIYLICRLNMTTSTSTTCIIPKWIVYVYVYILNVCFFLYKLLVLYIYLYNSFFSFEEIYISLFSRQMGRTFWLNWSERSSIVDCVTCSLCSLTKSKRKLAFDCVKIRKTSGVYTYIYICLLV